MTVSVLSVCLSSTLTLVLHSPEGAAVSRDATVSCKGHRITVLTHGVIVYGLRSR